MSSLKFSPLWLSKLKYIKERLKERKEGNLYELAVIDKAFGLRTGSEKFGFVSQPSP